MFPLEVLLIPVSTYEYVVDKVDIIELVLLPIVNAIILTFIFHALIGRILRTTHHGFSQ